MIALDSSALIAILRREPEADSFLHIITAADGCLLPPVSVIETSTAFVKNLHLRAASAHSEY